MSFLKSIFRPSVLREGIASRVVFYFPLEEGTYLDNPHVVVYKNGIVEIQHAMEKVTTHVQNLEIIWTNRRITSQNKKFKLLKMSDRRI